MATRTEHGFRTLPSSTCELLSLTLSSINFLHRKFPANQHSSIFFPLRSLLSCNRKHESDHNQSESNPSYFPKEIKALGESSLVNALNTRLNSWPLVDHYRVIKMVNKIQGT